MTGLRLHLEVETDDVRVGSERDGELRAAGAALHRRLGRGIAAAEDARTTTNEQQGNKGLAEHGLNHSWAQGDGAGTRARSRAGSTRGRGPRLPVRMWGKRYKKGGLHSVR